MKNQTALREFITSKQAKQQKKDQVKYRKMLKKHSSTTIIDIHFMDEVYSKVWKCKRCNWNGFMEDYNFCPNCGKTITQYEEAAPLIP